jgi:5'-nucleotidase
MKPLILVTNDDGISSKGIKALVDVVKEIGHVIVLAPDSPQSGMGHAITVNNLLRMSKSILFEGVDAYTCSGTPVDCVKLGISELLKRKPDLLVSGINHGENTSTNVLYSGTMSAAVEGAMENIPSIGFSLADFDSDADFEASKVIVKQVVEQVLKNKLPSGTCLNVNIPKGKVDELKGIKVCRAAKAYWEDSFDKRHDQFGNPYFWLTGKFENHDKGEDTDLFALKNGYASIVPVHFDLTAYHAISELNDWNWK